MMQATVSGRDTIMLINGMLPNMSHNPECFVDQISGMVHSSVSRNDTLTVSMLDGRKGGWPEVHEVNAIVIETLKTSAKAASMNAHS